MGGMQEKAKEAASQVADKAKNAAGTVVDKAKDAASSVAETAGNIASTVGKKAEQATEAVGGGMRSFGETIREHGPSSGILGGATSTVAGALEGAGGYLEHEGLSGMGRDVTNLLRRYPFAALAVGVCVGYMMARALRS
jgi:hypothetical protein